MTFFQVTWFFLVGVLFTGFAILDGFDLGVGVWYLKTKSDDERRLLLNAIGPVWDGNEVWLLTGGGALFAAFPPVYATVFSGFYLAMMLVILCFVVRAVSLEFRSKEKSALWRSAFDMAFSLSSILAGLLFGLALGNVMRGIPLDDHGDYSGSFFDLLNPYSLLIGITALVMFSFHGANFIRLKSTEVLETRSKVWSFASGIVLSILFIIATISTWFHYPHLTENFRKTPILWLLPATSFTFISLSIFWTKHGTGRKAIVASSVSIVGMMGIVGAALFPRLVPALGNIERSLTTLNSSSCELTLKTMSILALLGMPLVLGYTFWVYRAFSGKVDVNSPSNHY